MTDDDRGFDDPPSKDYRTEKQKIKDNLQMFIACVENGKQPPDRLMKFMADGARGFLDDGQPWHTIGVDGRPVKLFRDQQYYYILNKLGKMSGRVIVDVFGIIGPDGEDTVRQMHRDIKKGKLDLGIDLTLHPFPPFGANETQYSNLKAALDDLLSGSVADLSRHPKVLDKLKSLRAKIEAAEAEWSQEPDFRH